MYSKEDDLYNVIFMNGRQQVNGVKFRIVLKMMKDALGLKRLIAWKFSRYFQPILLLVTV